MVKTTLLNYNEIKRLQLKKQDKVIYDPLLDNKEISLQFEAQEMYTQAQNLMMCRQKTFIIGCGCGFWTVSYTCKIRICPSCSKSRANKYYNTYYPYIGSLKCARSIYDKGLRLLTLTIKNQKDLVKSINDIYESFIRLRRRSYFKNRVKGGLGAIEITKDKQNMYHTHVHLIVDSSYLAMKHQIGKDSKLVKEWKIASKGSSIVDIRKISYAAGGLKYVLKYISKGSNIPIKEYPIFYKLTKKRRLLFTFGTFYNHKAQLNKPYCPQCGCSYFFAISEISEIYGREPPDFPTLSSHLKEMEQKWMIEQIT